MFAPSDLPALTQHVLDAYSIGRTVLLLIGGHPGKFGLSRFLIDLTERRLVIHFAMNGSGLIHNFELALAGGTSEDVASWVKVAQFGLWHETGHLNQIIRDASHHLRKLSGYYHCLKDEVFYLHSGQLLVRFGQGDHPATAESITLLFGMSFEVPPGLRQ